MATKYTDRGFNLDTQPKAVQRYISILEADLTKLRDGMKIMGGVGDSNIEVRPWTMSDPHFYLPEHTQVRFFLEGLHNHITCRISKERDGDWLRVDASKMLTVEPMASNVVQCKVRQPEGRR